MNHRQRLEAAFRLEEPDHTPILGGWIACPEHIAGLAGVDERTYWDDPISVSLDAYGELGSDGLIGVFVPSGREDFRCVDHETYQKAVGEMSLRDALERIDAMPQGAQIEEEFDFEAEYAEFSRSLRDMQDRCGEMVWMPAQWSGGARVTWYAEFGYENFFCIVGGYPDRARKLMEVGGAHGHCRGRLVARAVRDGLYPKAVLLGEDICTQRGPMVSPQFLEAYYMPALARGLEPLLEAGCKPVWHSDGDVRPLMDMLLEAGVQGFQGFQPECGMTLDMVVEKRTRDGDPLLVFGPLAVTTELPVCTPREIKEKVRRAVEVCEGRASLVMFTSNTINPDVPLENIIAMHEAVRECG
ncbi:MAG: uroporphyrinogen decarboxylase family protein [Candidatus Brocadiia bacterium]